MPGVSRRNLDKAGGLNFEGSENVFTNSRGTVRLGDRVLPHDGGIHIPFPPMVQSSKTVFCNGRGVVRKGDLARCGHPDTGSDNVFAG